MNPLEGEIWRIGLDPTVGAEVQKTRPCVIVSSPGVNNLKLRVVVPITEWNPATMARRPWFVELEPDSLNGLEKASAAACHHIRSVALERFVQRIGRASADDLSDVRDGLKIALNLK